MGNWGLTGILLTIGLFFLIFSFVLAQIQVTNPYGGSSSAFDIVIGWIVP